MLAQVNTKYRTFAFSTCGDFNTSTVIHLCTAIDVAMVMAAIVSDIHAFYMYIAIPQPLDDSSTDKNKHRITVKSMMPPPPEVNTKEIVRRDSGKSCFYYLV